MIIPIKNDDVKIMLRSVVLYEEDTRKSVVVRVEVLHQNERHHPVEIWISGEPAKGMGSSDDGFRSVTDGFCGVSKIVGGEMVVAVYYGKTSGEVRVPTA